MPILYPFSYFLRPLIAFAQHQTTGVDLTTIKHVINLQQKYLDKSTSGFVSAYRDILTDAGPAYRSILLYLASLPPPSVTTSARGNPIGALIHCTAGKDRTGIFIALLLSFLGVPDDLIADEYHLTELGLAHIYEDVIPRLMASPAFERYKAEQLAGEGEEAGVQAARRMLGAKREAVLGALEMLRGEWGSEEGYLRGVCGLGDGELQALRRVLLV